MAAKMAHRRIRKFNTKHTYPEQNLDNDLAQAVVTLREEAPSNGFVNAHPMAHHRWMPSVAKGAPPLVEFRPGVVAGQADLIEVVHSGPPEAPARGGKAGRLDNVGGHVQARAEPQNRSGILGDIRLEKRDLHGLTGRSRSPLKCCK